MGKFIVSGSKLNSQDLKKALELYFSSNIPVKYSQNRIHNSFDVITITETDEEGLTSNDSLDSYGSDEFKDSVEANPSSSVSVIVIPSNELRNRSCEYLTSKYNSGSDFQMSTEYQKLELNYSRALICLENAHTDVQLIQSKYDSVSKKLESTKNALTNTLWSHCTINHPDLTHIPSIGNFQNNFIEDETYIGKYKLGKVLGQGQYAIVKEALYNEADRTCTCAVKMIKKDMVLNFAGLKNVSREIEILSKLKSANIVSFKDVIHTEKYLYIMMEKGGGDLFTFFDLYPEGVSEDCARNIISNLLKAVHYIHSQSICHRDLKPENLLLEYDQINGKCLSLKICDFGLGAIIKDQVALKDFCGSPGFFAPEMLLNESYSGDKADIWSVGCILLEMILGSEKFCDIWMSAYDKKSLSSLNKENFRSLIKDALHILPNLVEFSDDLKDFILKFFHLNPSERPSSEELLNHPWLAVQKKDCISESPETNDHYPRNISPKNSHIIKDRHTSNSKLFVLPEIKDASKNLVSK